MNKPKTIDTRKNIKTITSNSFITAKGLEKLSLKARKMLYIAISQCRKDDKAFDTYEISIKEFAEMIGITPKAVYPEANHITDELISGALYTVQQESALSIFSICEYRDGVFCFKLDSDMDIFLLKQKKNFSQPLLNDFLKMKSTYSIAIWHLMQREMHSHKPNLDNTLKVDLLLEELREVTGTTKKLKQLGQFKERCFDKALREINENCGVKVTYENIKRGHRVVGFRCSAKGVIHT